MNKIIISLLTGFFLSFINVGFAETPQTTAPLTTNPSITTNAISDDAVLTLAKNTALNAFNYDFQNYTQRLQELSKNFTAKGWTDYNNALNESGNIRAMQQNKLAMAGQITGTPNIISKTFYNNNNIWYVVFPMKVTYTNDKNQTITSNILLKIGITTIPTTTNLKGIAVNQFIAGPDINKK